jgi:hypothetical protein
VPGWPRTTAANVNLTGGVLFTDLDGDRVPEVVASGVSITLARVWAWHLDGTPVSGFPVDPGTVGMSAIAAGDLDGVPGDELAFLDANASLHLVGGDGLERTGFPTAPLGTSRAPVIARLGRAGTPPSIVVASTGVLNAFASDGSVRWSAPITGNPVQDPALADFDGDGVDEILLALASPNTIVARDSSGAAFTARAGWPIALTAAPGGPLAVGPLKPGGEPCTALFMGTALNVFDGSGQVVRGFPRPGQAGLLSSLDDLDGDGATEIAAGTAAPDSNQYTYDAGAGSFNAAALAWPTARGSVARTASHAQGALAPFVIDRRRPARITDVVVRAVSNTTAEVRFTHTGEDSLVGTVARLELRVGRLPLGESNFETEGVLVRDVTPRVAGSPDTLANPRAARRGDALVRAACDRCARAALGDLEQRLGGAAGRGTRDRHGRSCAGHGREHGGAHLDRDRRRRHRGPAAQLSHRRFARTARFGQLRRCAAAVDRGGPARCGRPGDARGATSNARTALAVRHHRGGSGVRGVPDLGGGRGGHAGRRRARRARGVRGGGTAAARGERRDARLAG